MPSIPSDKRRGMPFWAILSMVLLPLTALILLYLRRQQAQNGEPSIQRREYPLERMPEPPKEIPSERLREPIPPEIPEQAAERLPSDAPVQAEMSAPAEAAPAPDDLTIIEGIGPRIRTILQESGISTFRQLAETPADRLRTILVDAGLYYSDPGTWPEQAGLAAEGRWQALVEMKSNMRGGRRIA